MAVDLISALYLGSIIHGFMLTLVLAFNRHSNRTANSLLAALTFLVVLTVWNVFVYRTSLPSEYLLLDRHLPATPLLWGPILYLYIVIFTQTRPLKRMDLVHGLLAIAALVLQLPIHFLANEWLAHWAWNVVYGMFFPQIFAYLLAAYIVLRRFSRVAQNFSSSAKDTGLVWLKTALLLFSSAILFDMALFVPQQFDVQVEAPLLDGVLIAEAIIIFAVGYFSLRQPEVLAGINLDEERSVIAVPEKYSNSAIGEALGKHLAKELDQLMQQEKLFLRNTLSLAELSGEMRLEPHQLSQVINQHHGVNFYEYVNRFRTQHAAQELRTRGKVNLTRLAFDSGFNNRVSFNKSFRKAYGSSPTEFIKGLAE